MPRIVSIVNEAIEFYDPLFNWVDVGTGDGKLVSGLKWANTIKNKYYMEYPSVPNILDKREWVRINNINQITEKIDLLTLFDVIEHFDKQRGEYKLDHYLEKATHVIIFTPDGFFPQKGTKENQHMEHLSGWTKEDFTKRGMVVGILENFHYHTELERHFNAILAWK